MCGKSCIVDLQRRQVMEMSSDEQGILKGKDRSRFPPSILL
jgi:hypothetical protein